MPEIAKAVLALDVDGVLNEFSWDAGGHIGPWAKAECVEQLDRIVVEAGCDIVLVSTWRSLVNNGLMTPRGFGALLMTHGMKEAHRLVGVTARGRLADRGEQVRAWWRANPQYDRLVALDDMNLGYDDWGIKLVQTDGRVGLTAADADRAIAILRGEQP